MQLSDRNSISIIAFLFWGVAGDLFCLGFSICPPAESHRTFDNRHAGSVVALQSSSPPSMSETSVETGTKPETNQQRFTWIDRVHQLLEYKQQFGHTLVPKRFPPNPSLGNWVIKQRTLYKTKYSLGLDSALTREQVDVLNEVGFCWDATHASTITKNAQDKKKKEEFWWAKFNELQSSCTSAFDGALTPSQSRWLRQQRVEYGSGALEESKASALTKFDPEWYKTIRQKQWDDRCRELVDYEKEHGNCCVPISYHKNKKLANWVSNLRKQYNLREAGKESNLSSEKIDELNKLGFVWNRWEYEFENKLSSLIE